MADSEMKEIPPKNSSKTASNESIAGGQVVNTEASALLKKDEDGIGSRALLFGVGFALLYAISTVLSIPCLQLLGHSVQPLMLLFYGFLAHLLTSIPVWGACWGRLLKLECEQAKWLSIAALCNATSTALYYMSAQCLPSGVVGALGQGSLLLFSIIVTGIIDKHVSKVILVATVVCVIGLIMYMTSVTYYDPVTVVATVNVTEDSFIAMNSRNALTSFHPSMSYILLVLSSITYIAANAIMHKKLSQASFSKVLVFFPLIGLVVCTVLLFSLTTPHWDLDLSEPLHLFPFIAFIILFVVSNLSLYSSWMRTPPPVFSLIAAGSIAFLVLLQYVINVPGIQSGHPDVLEILGAILILVANAIGTIGELDLKAMVTHD